LKILAKNEHCQYQEKNAAARASPSWTLDASFLFGRKHADFDPGDSAHDYPALMDPPAPPTLAADAETCSDRT